MTIKQLKGGAYLDTFFNWFEQIDLYIYIYIYINQRNEGTASAIYQNKCFGQ